MEYPLSYYEKRNRQIAREFVNDSELLSLCVKYKLGRRQIINVLSANRILVVERKRMKRKKTPTEILAECGLTRYQVRRALFRINGLIE